VTDSQLPRYEIFIVERPGRPPTYAGSVHASDDELALLNARDVFARRPDCHGLWAFRAESISSRTAEETLSQAEETEPARREPYLVFGKLGHKGVHTFLGAVEAAGPDEAVGRGRALYRQDVVLWWVAPERCRVASAAEDAGPMFEPAKGKPFRDQAFYPVETLMRQLRRARNHKQERS
jgi:ring-1,2-phenylacetyl-CoA epoxidase subunit PaaB